MPLADVARHAAGRTTCAAAAIPRARAPRRGVRLQYEEFKKAVRQICQRPDAVGGPTSIPQLRDHLADCVDRDEFDRYLTWLHGDGLVHLLSHADPGSLPDTERAQCLPHPSGLLAYWVHWP
jgi:hypothetical protein